MFPLISGIWKKKPQKIKEGLLKSVGNWECLGEGKRVIGGEYN